MTTDQTATFEDLGLGEGVMQAVRQAGFRQPSPIQTQAIPHILEGRDLIGQAHTGTGKTAAFGLPAIDMLKNTGHVEVLVITPTRELAMQVSDELYRFGKAEGHHTTTVYGGQSYGRQIERLSRGTPVVVATPGRLLDLLKSGRAKNLSPWLVILDEADEMLDMGFLEDIKEIFKHLPDERQTLLFSATMPDSIRKLAKTILKDPVHVSVMAESRTSTNIDQRYYVIDEHERDAAIIRLIDSFEPKKSIVFCRTKAEVERISTIFIGRGYSARPLHGDMDQKQREEVIAAFRSGRIYTLVATDVAARGLDVKDVTHVFNYHLPFNTESYVHRIGRTGRAGNEGMAVTLVTPKEYRDLSRIQKFMGDAITQRFVPTGDELRGAMTTKLLERILATEPNPMAAETTEALIDAIGKTETISRLVTLLMQEETVEGPNTIGLNKSRIERMMQPSADTRKPKKRQWKKSGPPRKFNNDAGGKPRKNWKDRKDKKK